MGGVTTVDSVSRRSWIENGLWIILIQILFACSTEPKPQQEVYITDTGLKFHLENCRYLKLSRHAMVLDSALAGGYTACKVCRPLDDHSHENEARQKAPRTSIPERQLSHSVRCTSNKVNGIQCKRMTKNASGKCWQHNK